MGQELRIRFHQDLDEIDSQVRRLFGLVCERVSAATESLVADDAHAAREVAGSDVQVDRLEGELERAVERLLLMESPMASEMRYLVTVLRIVPQLERCGDLAEHVANRSIAGLGPRLTPRIRGLLTEMGNRCCALWQGAAAAWSARVDDSTRLDEIDDELDQLHEQLTEEILVAGMDVADVMQATLVGRFYERLGDHAVHISQRIAYIAPPGSSTT